MVCADFDDRIDICDMGGVLVAAREGSVSGLGIARCEEGSKRFIFALNSSVYSSSMLPGRREEGWVARWWAGFTDNLKGFVFFRFVLLPSLAPLPGRNS